MLGWWKKNDGFEWKEYVRTTILVKRKKRKDKLKNAQAAAVQGLKAAGKAGVSAGTSSASTVGPAIGRALAALGRAPAWLFSTVAPPIGGMLGGLRNLLAKGLGPLLERLSPPNLRGPFAIIGAIALLAVAARYPANGIDAQSQMAAAIGFAAVLLAGLPWLLTAKGLKLPKWLLDPLTRLSRNLPPFPKFGTRLGSVGPGALGVALLVSAIAGGSWLYGRSGSISGTASSVLSEIGRAHV